MCELLRGHPQSHCQFWEYWMSRGSLGEGVSCGMEGLGPDSVYPLSKQDPNCGTTTGARQVLSSPRVGTQGAALGSRQKPLETEIVPLFLQIAQL